VGFLERDLLGFLEHLGFAVDNLLEEEEVDLAGVRVVVGFKDRVGAVLFCAAVSTACSSALMMISLLMPRSFPTDSITRVNSVAFISHSPFC
jgi:hypothetical protein